MPGLEDFLGVWVNVDANSDPARVIIRQQGETIQVDSVPLAPLGDTRTHPGLLIGPKLSILSHPGAPRITLMRDGTDRGRQGLAAEIAMPALGIRPGPIVHCVFVRRRPAAVEDFLGTWVNADRRARSLSRVVVDQGAELWVHVFDRVGNGLFEVLRGRMAGVFESLVPQDLPEMRFHAAGDASPLRTIEWGVIRAQTADGSSQIILSRVGSGMAVLVLTARGDPSHESAVLDPAPRAWIRVREAR